MSEVKTSVLFIVAKLFSGVILLNLVSCYSDNRSSDLNIQNDAKCLESVSQYSQPTFASLFTNYAVLQRDYDNLPIWGSGTNGDVIEVRLSSYDSTVQFKKTVQVDNHGNWIVYLPKLSTNLALLKKDLKLEASSSCSQKVTKLDNLIAGDVFICSGQSNMKFQIKDSTNPSPEEIENKYLSQLIRTFSVKRSFSDTPLSDFDNTHFWKLNAVENITNFSVLCYMTGFRLQESESISVGLIDSSVGGSWIEAWTSKNWIENHLEVFGPILQYWLSYPDSHVGVEINPITQPSQIFNAMINPLKPYGIKSFVWYQGEGNAGRGFQYRDFLSHLVQDWRNNWNIGESNPGMLPFTVVQLPILPSRDIQFSVTRESQEVVANTLKNVSIVVSYDLSFPDIHPQNKLELSSRVHQSLLRNSYGKTNDFDGPIISRIDKIAPINPIDPGKLVLSFRNAQKGLYTDSSSNMVNGFLIAGIDGNFIEGFANIKNSSQIEVWSDKIQDPEYVRYGWSMSNVPDTVENSSKFSLTNGVEIPDNGGRKCPAHQFRNDELPVFSQGIFTPNH